MTPSYCWQQPVTKVVATRKVSTHAPTVVVLVLLIVVVVLTVLLVKSLWWWWW